METSPPTIRTARPQQRLGDAAAEAREPAGQERTKEAPAAVLLGTLGKGQVHVSLSEGKMEL